MADAQLYDEAFTITSVNNFQYDRVSRITAQSDDGTQLILDVNNELFPVAVDDRLSLMLASTLNLDGSKSEAGWRDLGKSEATLADMYEYVCHGKIYHFGVSETDKDVLSVYISYGGLLMQLSGQYKKLTSLKVDYVYLLLKK
ncbi:RNA polymerase [Saccharata proteae CBS 121410]|uniref:DNA-directed RNA polymerases I, II, and III subunit RPABC3 n=1 Tax=Saccharata proteae CBS 121410 TaxID=1314787 RepID=A0A9P4LUW5_9PEZI|nr:RNA polymerase [Saccharata proteae CBS 121410]